MFRPFLVFISLLCLLGSCAYQPTICPAYQSAYIHDKDALRKKFSYFVNDSSPKVYAANKSKFLIIEPTTYKKKVRSLQTIEKKSVPVLLPDSLKDGFVADEEFSMAERNVDDGTAVLRIDTLEEVDKKSEEYVITTDRELRVLKYDAKKKSYWVDTLGYNSEQDNYMWYLRHVLVLPDAKLAAMESKNLPATEKSKQKSASSKGGIFKRASKKEKAVPSDGFTGTTSATILADDSKPKREKRKKKKEKPVKAAPVDPTKKTEEDDGF